jgi:GNAT superfamily N-acetyltransferase
MPITIRPAAPTDQAAIFALVTQFAISFTPQQSAFEASFSRLLKEESACLSVAESEEGVIGYCLGFDHDTFYANGRVAWVEEIMVLEAYRRHHIGQNLMDAFEAWAITRGSILVALATRRAASFYTALGYEESATYFRKILLRHSDDPTSAD